MPNAATRNPTNRVAIQQSLAATPALTAGADVGTPEGILDQQLQSLQAEFRPREQRLVGDKLPAKDHKRQMSLLQREYDDRKSDLMLTRSAFERIQQGMESGAIDDDAGLKAMFGLVSTREEMEARFPKPVAQGATRRPFSPQALKSQAVVMEEFARGAPTTPAFFKPRGAEDVPQEGLIEQYLAARTNAGYDALNPIEQGQFDSQWDALMQGDSNYKWNPASTDVKSLRTRGNRLLNEAAKLASPVAKSVLRSKKRTFRGFGATASRDAAPQTAQGGTLDANTASAILAEAGGDKSRAREMARQRGFKF